MARKVLVVDDEKLIVKGIRFSLEQDSMEVDCAYDGEEALEYAKKTEYDVVLLDIMLPKLNGFEVCQRIREFSNMPIIMLTAKTEDMDKILGLEYGADDYIAKPFNILEVKARIKAIMRRSKRTEKEKDQDAGLSETEAIPYTLYTIDVEKVYKGPLKEPTITIKRPGGKFENNEYITENAPEILTGRDYLFIAESYENSYPSLLNPTQSAYDMGASQDAEKKKKTDITAADILALFGSFE